MTIYLAGPMTGIPRWNFPAFDEAAARLRAAGYKVISPAELDREAGFDENTTELPLNFRREALARDCDAICRKADAVALLDGWGKSSGARADATVGLALNLAVLPIEKFLIDDGILAKGGR